jgi:hypothetical protein
LFLSLGIAGWQDCKKRRFSVPYGTENLWLVLECFAGIKLLITTGTLVRNNRVGRIQAGSGIWLDWNNRNSRVTGNFIHDVSTAQAAIFIEASQAPNLVDHNVIWNINGQGVKAGDTDQLTVAHNLLGLVREELVFAKVITDRSLGGRKMTATGNKVINNIFFEPGKPIAFDAGNTASYNLYVSSRETAVMKHAAEEDSPALTADVRLKLEELLIEWQPGKLLPAVPLVSRCDRDFFGSAREGALTVPGPFGAPVFPSPVRLGADPQRLGR